MNTPDLDSPKSPWLPRLLAVAAICSGLLFALDKWLGSTTLDQGLTGSLIALALVGALVAWQRLERNERGLVVATLAVLLLTTLVELYHYYGRDPRLSVIDILRPTRSVIDILRPTVMLGIFSLGAAIVIISGGIDLSAGSVIAFSGTICATILVLVAPEEMKNARPLGMGPISLAITGTLVVGLLIGSLHTWLITVVGLPPFVATLATLVGLRSLGRAIVETATQAMLGGKSTQITIYDSSFRYLSTSVWIPMAIFIVLAAMVWLLLSKTVTGRHLYALGGNEQAARLSGIRTDRLKWLAYCTSAVLSSIAGILYICEQSVADPQTLGRGYELNAIAAAVVGGCSLQGGVGTVAGTMLGALFLRTVIDGISKIIKTGADVYEGLIVGFLVVLAVAFNQLRQSGLRRQFFPGALGIVAGLTLVLLAGTVVTVMIGAKPGAAVALVSLFAVSIWKFVELRLSLKR